MNATNLVERPLLANEVTIAPDESGYTLNVAGVYQDIVTRDWALQTCHRAAQLAEVERVQYSWYKSNFLSNRVILRDAIRAALVADVIVISVYAADELPVQLCVWIDAWLPRRVSRARALKALIVVAEPLDHQSVRTHDYFQAVARQGQLDFLPQKRKRSVATSVSPIKLITAPASAISSMQQELDFQRCDAYRHWGIN